MDLQHNLKLAQRRDEGTDRWISLDSKPDLKRTSFKFGYGERIQSVQRVGEGVKFVHTKVANGAGFVVEWGQRYGALLQTAVEERADVRGHQEGTWHGTARGNTGRQRERPLHRGYSLKQNVTGAFSSV